MRKPLFAWGMILALAVLSDGLGAGPAPDQRSGLVALNEQMVALLEKIEAKLVEDEATLQDGWAAFQRSAFSAIEGGSLARSILNRAALAPKLRAAWNDRNLRQAVLFNLAQIDLAVDAIARSQREELQALEAERRQSYRNLVTLVKRIRAAQRQILIYFKDDSARKKLGDLDLGLIAAGIAEARNLQERSRLSVAKESARPQELEARLDQAVQQLRAFLEKIG